MTHQYKTPTPMSEKVLWASVVAVFVLLAIGAALKALGLWEGF